MARSWSIVGTSVAVLTFSGWGWILYNSRDLASVEETGLRLHGRLLPSDENAAFPLREAASQVYWPGGEDARHRVRALRTFSSWDGGFARDLVDRNEAALDGFEQAMRLPQIEISAAELSAPCTQRLGQTTRSVARGWISTASRQERSVSTSSSPSR